MQNPELWTHLKIHPLVPPEYEDAFVDKLMRAQGWTPAQAKGAIEEYRRFLYLTQVMESEATPSEPVDAVWHLHMTYTHAYWDDLCKGVLGRKLHHLPGADAAEMPRFRAQYAETRRRYEVEFGQEPPRLFWPGPRAEKPKIGANFAFGLAVAAFAVNQITGSALALVAAFALGFVGLALHPRATGRRNKGGAGCSAGFGGCDDGHDGGGHSADCGASCGGSSCGGGD